MKTYNTYLLYILIILASIFFLYTQMKFKQKNIEEGFQQDKPFLLKQNQDIYDPFYAEIYDTVSYPQVMCSYIANKIVEHLNPSPKYSTMLCVGSGTGALLKTLHDNHIDNIYGIDKSEAMVNISKEKYPKLPVKLGDVLDSMNYERSTFTHIFCLNHTYYEIEDKSLFFRNCYYWLKPNSFLILHLVDGTKYDPLGIKASPHNVGLLTKYSKKTVKHHKTDFPGFSYSNDFKVSGSEDDDEDRPSACVVTQKETFVDKTSANIRENERTLRIEPVNSVLRLAIEQGFIVHGKFLLEESPVNDPHQYIYILERSH